MSVAKKRKEIVFTPVWKQKIYIYIISCFLLPGKGPNLSPYFFYY